jgi:hypothetical protein
MIQIDLKKIAINLVRYVKENWVTVRLLKFFKENWIAIKLRRYVKANWGSPFIIGFIVLLLSAAVSLSDSLATYAYYTLVIGIFLELASFLRYRGESNDEVSI